MYAIVLFPPIHFCSDGPVLPSILRGLDAAKLITPCTKLTTTEGIVQPQPEALGRSIRIPGETFLLVGVGAAGVRG